VDDTSGGSLDKSECEAVCTGSLRCVAFSWRSNYECYTYATCDSPALISGAGDWVGYLYIKLNMAGRLERTNYRVRIIDVCLFVFLFVDFA
jgi:hypothetical protein